MEHIGNYKDVDVYVAFEFNNEIWLHPLSSYSQYNSNDADNYPLRVEAQLASNGDELKNPDGTTVYTQTPRSAEDIVAGAKRIVEKEIESYMNGSEKLTRTQALLRVRNSAHYYIKQ